MSSTTLRSCYSSFETFLVSISPLRELHLAKQRDFFPLLFLFKFIVTNIMVNVAAGREQVYTLALSKTDNRAQQMLTFGYHV